MTRYLLILLFFVPITVFALSPKEVTKDYVGSNKRAIIALESIGYVPVPVDPLFEKIGWCESRNYSDAKSSISSASGRFQFLKGSWEYYGKQLWNDDWVKKDVFSYEDNTELAWFVYSQYGTKDWLASTDCWGKI